MTNYDELDKIAERVSSAKEDLDLADVGELAALFCEAFNELFGLSLAEGQKHGTNDAFHALFRIREIIKELWA